MKKRKELNALVNNVRRSKKRPNEDPLLSSASSDEYEVYSARRPNYFSRSTSTCSVLCFTLTFVLSIVLFVYLIWSLLSLQHQVNVLTAHIDVLNSKTQTNTDSINSNSEKIEALSKRVSQSEKSEQSQLDLNSKVQSNYDSLRSEFEKISSLASIKEQNEKFKQDIVNSINALQSKIDASATQTSATTTKEDTSDVLLTDAESVALKTLEKSIKSVTVDVAKLRQEVNHLKLNSSEFENYHKRVSPIIDANLPLQLSNIDSKLHQLNITSCKLVNDFATLNQSLLQLSAQSSNTSQTVSVLRSTVSSLNNSFEQMKQSVIVSPERSKTTASTEGSTIKNLTDTNSPKFTLADFLSNETITTTSTTQNPTNVNSSFNSTKPPKRIARPVNEP